MNDITSLPHIKLQRTRRYLPQPRDTREVLIVNAKDSKSIGELMNKPEVLHLNKYQRYYIPSRYKTKIFNRLIIENLFNERMKMIEEAKAIFPIIKPELTVQPTTKGLIYDMSFWNKIFFDNVRYAISYKTICQTYIDIIKDVVRDKEIQGFNKTMLIDLEAWGSFNNEIGKVDYLNTPLLIIYFSMWKFPKLFKSIGDINIVFMSSKGMIRLNPALTEEASFRQFKIELEKLNNLIDWGNIDKIAYDYERAKFLTNDIVSKFNLVGDGATAAASKVEDAVNKAVARASDKVETPEEKTKKKTEKEETEVGAKILDEVENDEKLAEDVSKILKEEKAATTTLSKRDEELRKKQETLKFKGSTLKDILDDTTSVQIPETKLNMGLVNKNMDTIRFSNFEKAYNEKLHYHDMFSMISMLNECEIPVFIRDISVEDTSDEMTFKETVTVQLEDANRVRHNLKFDMPIFVEDKFLYLNGNRKVINKQLLLKPIVKTKEDEVQVVTNYNKIFLRRYGAKLSSKTEKLRKTMLDSKDVKRGNNRLVNSQYLTTIEYDELGKTFTSIKAGNFEALFSQQAALEIAEKLNIKVPEGKLLVGFEDKKTPVYVDLKTQMIGEKDIVDYIVNKLPEAKKKAFNETTTGKKFLYTRATIMAKQVPLILLLGYCEGLTSVLRKAQVKHYFTDKRPKLEEGEGYVQFADGYLVYDMYPYENSLLMNAFADIPTKGFNYEEMDSKEAYGSIFETMFNQRNLTSAFDNFYDFMIDPISKQVLNDLNYPTDFVGVLLYANKLMSDNAFVNENDMSLYRVRSNELVNAYLYKAIADAYGNYRRTAYNNNPTKISIRQDHITKSLLTAQTVEDYSVLNPIVEIEKVRVISAKGPSGLNLSQAYTLDKRGYDPTMLGSIAMSTSPDANVGVVRQLTLEPKITNARGYIQVMNDKLDELKDVNIFSPAELISPLGATRDDSSRTAMAVKQSKHIIPVKKSSPVLVSNGMERTIHHHVGKDFAVTAKYDGVVKEVDEKSGMVILEYVTGTREAFDITPRVVKNGAGGFYLSNKLDLKLKPGAKFKANDIIAADEAFFSDTNIHGNKFNIGSLQKIAVMGGYYTYEDSTAITTKLSRDMASDIIMVKDVTLGKNANVEGLVKKGQAINVGDELLRFETSFEDDSINEMLRSFGGEVSEQIQSLGKKPIVSKYTGEIADVKVYTTVEIDELSPSLQAIVKEYHGTIKKKQAVIKKYTSNGTPYDLNHMMTEPTSKVDAPDGKVKGNLVGEGVLIQIFIKYEDTMGVGDKLAYFTALKSIIGEIIPEGYEPWSEHKPDEEVSAFIAPAAILARMTPSIFPTMLTNKVLIGLKDNLQEIYES